MTDSFPSTFPKDYRVVYSPGVNLIWAIFDAEDQCLGRFVGKAKALEFSWKRYLNRLNYHGVATLIAALQETNVATGLREEIAAIRSAKEQKEARIAELQREVLQSEGREQATSDCAEAALQSWKTEANDAHKKVEELEAELVAANATLKRVECMAQAAKKVNDTLMGCFSNPVVPAKVTTATAASEPEPEPGPIDPAFDFDGPVPEGMPSGYRVEHQGDRKPMAYKVFGPGGMSISCFTTETAHEKAWEHIRDINKEKVKNGMVAPRAAAPPVKTATKTDPNSLPDGYTYEHTSSRYPHKLTRPGGHGEYFANREQLIRAAHHHAEKHGNDHAAVTALAVVKPAGNRNNLPTGYTTSYEHNTPLPHKLKRPDGTTGCFHTRLKMIAGAWDHVDKEAAKATTSPPVAHNRKNPPPSYFIKSAFGAYRFALVRPNGKEEKFFTDHGALEAAWIYYDEARGKVAAETKPHPALSPSAHPPEGYMFTSTHRSAKYRLHFPGDRTADFQSKVARYDAAWDHFRNREPAKEAANEKPANTATTELPPGFKDMYMGPASQSPYKLTPPKGSPRYYKTPADLVEDAWKMSKEPAYRVPVQSIDPPSGYTFSYDSNNTRASWKLELPGGPAIWFMSRQARLKAAWIHNEAPYGKKAERIEGMERYPASFEHTLPDGYKRERTQAQHNPHKLTNPGGSCQYFSSPEDMHTTAWEHFRVNSIKKDPAGAARNAKRLPPGYGQTYGNPQQNYALMLPNKDEMCFISDEARLVASWVHHDCRGDKMASIRGMGAFPRGYQYKLPPGYSCERETTTRANPYKLIAPDHGVYFLPDLHAGRRQAWEHYRVAMNKEEDEKTKAAVSVATATVPTTSGSTGKAPTQRTYELPPGYSNSYLGLSAMTPYKVTFPDGNSLCFKDRADMLETAWQHYDAAKAEPTPPRELAPLPPPGNKTQTPAMMPPHYNHVELEGAALRGHKLTGPNGYTDYFHNYLEALETAWRLSKANGPNWADAHKPSEPKVEETDETDRADDDEGLDPEDYHFGLLTL